MIKIQVFLFLFLLFGSLFATYSEFLIPIFPYLIAADASLEYSKNQMHELQEENIKLYEAIIEASRRFCMAEDLGMLKKYGEVYDQAVREYEEFGERLTEGQWSGFKKHRDGLPVGFYITMPIPEVLSLEQELYILSKKVEEFKILNQQDFRFLFSPSSPSGAVECKRFPWCKKRYPFILGCAYCVWYYLTRATVTPV